MQPQDTSRAASEIQREVVRRLGPVARVEMAFVMSQNAREISITGMMDREQTLSYAEARSRLLQRLLGADLYEAAFSRPSA